MTGGGRFAPLPGGAAFNDAAEVTCAKEFTSSIIIVAEEDFETAIPNVKLFSLVQCNRT